MKLPPDYKIVVTDRQVKITDLEPNSGTNGINVSLIAKYLEHLRENGPADKFHDAILIPDTMTEPTAVLEGLNRDQHEKCRCYCSKPPNRYTVSTVKGEIRPSPTNFVFCVFVKPLPDGFSVLDWGWRKEDPKKLGFPINWETDFEREIVPEIQHPED